MSALAAFMHSSLVYVTTLPGRAARLGARRTHALFVATLSHADIACARARAVHASDRRTRRATAVDLPTSEQVARSREPPHDGPLSFAALIALQSTAPSSFWFPHSTDGVSSACGGACVSVGAATADFALDVDAAFAAVPVDSVDSRVAVVRIVPRVAVVADAAAAVSGSCPIPIDAQVDSTSVSRAPVVTKFLARSGNPVAGLSAGLRSRRARRPPLGARALRGRAHPLEEATLPSRESPRSWTS